jgi:hypothetical protein
MHCHHGGTAETVSTLSIGLPGQNERAREKLVALQDVLVLNRCWFFRDLRRRIEGLSENSLLFGPANKHFFPFYRREKRTFRNPAASGN